ncbi:MAG: peptidoglycan-binding protein [Caulobacter sp.]|nr:peptidoglycan-binding protein [Caulobacter sp.]
MKGIDPKAREIAKDLARRSGMTLGEWLNRMIVEGEPVSGADYAPERALDAADEARVLEISRPQSGPRYEIPGHPADEVGRVADAMERLSQRIEAAEQRSTLAISGIDQSVRGALARLETSEREQVSVAARFEGAVDEIRTDSARVADRLRRLEQEAAGPRSAEALRSLEGMLGKVAGQMYDGEARTRETLAAVEARVADLEKSDPSNLVEAVAARVAERLEAAEARTTDALRDLGSSFVALDRRLKAVETTGGGAERLEALAVDLTARMEATRAELAEKLAASAELRFDRMDRRLSEMTQHVAAAETRSAQAIERVGREMVSMADNLSRKVQIVENRGADALEQVGGEVARIATAVEQKLSRADTAQAQALEKLGVEIARITERLAERIANSERRGALAIDEVGEQVARVTERISQRQERTATDLAERIRQSEERTARLLDEAREKIDASLSGSHRRLAEQMSPPVAPVAAAPRQPDPVREAFSDPFASDPFETATRAIPEDAFAPQVFSRMPAEAAPGDPAPFPAAERGAPSFSQEDFDAADEFVAISDEPEIPDAPEIAPPPAIEPFEVDPAPATPRSTRDVIEQARMAARAGGAAPATLAPAEERRSLFGARDRKPKKRAGSALMSAVLIATSVTTVGALSVGGLMYSGVIGGGGTSPRVEDSRRLAQADAKGEIKGPEADTTPRVAMAVSPAGPGQATTPPLAGAALTGEGVESAATLYAEAQRLIEARDPAGLDRLRRAANMGFAAAQFDLSKAYMSGTLGVKKDEAESRRWTERAAQAGDSRAMHNLGLAYFHGSGGPMNKTTAAQWFRRAADLGMGDSQYNLASLFEQGYGVTQNAAEAYKWYLIAGRGGDTEARSAAERLKKDLSPEARSAAERSAAGFRAATPNPSVRPTSVAAPAGGVASAQKALSMLGYYRGPQDGAQSAALKGAIQAFQRDKGLQATGNLDGETTSKLAIYTR